MFDQNFFKMCYKSGLVVGLINEYYIYGEINKLKKIFSKGDSCFSHILGQSVLRIRGRWNKVTNKVLINFINFVPSLGYCSGHI